VTTTTDMSPQTTRILRIVGWSTAVLLLIAPAVAMQFEGNGVDWTASDFIFAAVFFGIVGGLFELTARASTNFAYRIAVVLAVACGFLQIWINLAVGIIGNEDNSANWTYFAVVLMAAAGAIVALGNPRELARAMWSVAGAQAIFSIIHAVNGTPTPIIDGFFMALWIAAARLFARASREREVA
jgi:hypothetical protein